MKKEIFRLYTASKDGWISSKINYEALIYPYEIKFRFEIFPLISTSTSWRLFIDLSLRRFVGVFPELARSYVSLGLLNVPQFSRTLYHKGLR